LRSGRFAVYTGFRKAIRRQRKEFLRQKEHALEVDVVEAIQLLLGRLVECGVVRDAGVIDKIVETLRPEIRKRIVDLLIIRVLGRFV
jgi:hypothetical protein